MTTFKVGDRVVVESPVYYSKPDGLSACPRYFGHTGTVTALAVDESYLDPRNVRVKIDGLHSFEGDIMAPEGLLKIADLPRLAVERAPFKVGDLVEGIRPYSRKTERGVALSIDPAGSGWAERTRHGIVRVRPEGPRDRVYHLDLDTVRPVVEEPEIPGGFKVGEKVYVVKSAPYLNAYGARDRIGGGYPATVAGAGKVNVANVSVTAESTGLRIDVRPMGLVRVGVEEPKPAVAPAFKVGDRVTGRGFFSGTEYRGVVTDPVSPNGNVGIDVEGDLGRKYLSPESVALVEPVKPTVATATVRVDVRFFVGETDITDRLGDLADTLKEALA